MTGNRSVVACGWGERCREGQLDDKRYKETSGGDEYVHYFYCNDGFKGAYLCQNSSNSTCRVLIIPQ